jgi:hypothetical protein
MAFSLEDAVPILMRKEIEWAEKNFPTIPDTVPEVVAKDPGWCRQWTNTKRAIDRGQGAPKRPSDAKRRRDAAHYLAMLGHLEFELIVLGCSYAARNYEMPAAWKMCILKQGYDDMQHAASFITRASRMIEENLWDGIPVPYRKSVELYRPILQRDLGGFFAAIGLHTEAYPAWTNLSGGGAITDPVIGAWSLHEIEEEAWHLTFLMPAIKEYLHTGTSEEQDRRKLQMVADDQYLLERAVHPAHENAKQFAVGRLGMDPEVLYGYEHLDERTRYIYRTVGIDESYWPAYLKNP